MVWNLRAGRFFRALSTGSMVGPSAFEVIFIAVNHSITLMGEFTSLTEISWFLFFFCKGFFCCGYTVYIKVKLNLNMQMLLHLTTLKEQYAGFGNPGSVNVKANNLSDWFALVSC